jgi:hypothetical protein
MQVEDMRRKFSTDVTNIGASRVTEPNVLAFRQKLNAAR